MKELWTSMATLMGMLAFVQAVLHALFPSEVCLAAAALLRRTSRRFSSYCYFDITDTDGVSINELYSAVQLYLSRSASASCTSSSSGDFPCTRLSLTRALNSSAFTFGLSSNDRLFDVFRGAVATWEHVVTPRTSQPFSWRPLADEKRGFTLRLRKCDKNLILQPYLDHIMETAGEIRRSSQDRLLYTNSRGGGFDSGRVGHPWESVPFKHPSTFETLAMDPARKAEIMADLRDFADGRAFYQRTGRAWKRGYLLYGPPGTGKSSMIAAMANYLRYDIYDLELTEVHSNSDLRKLLMKTTSKSIVVIEDIDCSVNLGTRGLDCKKQGIMGSSGEEEASRSMTLSGLLNFTDGLWSCCGSERIFVFTTNNVERLDPALLRSGRMDMHVNMGYCSFPALRILLRSYLGWEEGKEEENGVVRELEGVVGEAEMTPADVSEVLIKNRRKGRREAMEKLLEELKEWVERKRRGGGDRDEGGGVQEQEKRALDSPKEGSEGEEPMEKCNAKKGLD